MSSGSTTVEAKQPSPVVKNKKPKKKKGRDKGKSSSGQAHLREDKTGGDAGDEGNEQEEQLQGEEGDEPESPVKYRSTNVNGNASRDDDPVDGEVEGVQTDLSSAGRGGYPTQSHHKLPEETPIQVNGDQLLQHKAADAFSEGRLDALAQERESLRQEVVQLRKSLEELRDRHHNEIQVAQKQIDEAKDEKEQAETQYRNLLGKVNTIRSQLGERLKADAEDLAQARNKIDDLEEECGSLRQQNEARTAELRMITDEREQQSKELSNLRNRSTLSQQNWIQEREDLQQRELHAKEEFEAAKQAMQDWEVLAMEERSIRESIADKLSDLEEQLMTHKEAHERAAAERDSQSLTVDGLQRALQEIQDARKRELREVVENSQAQMERLRKQLEEAQSHALEATKALEVTKADLERALPFETEVKEKNLLIGKLRHEAVILNDHLTKALKYLKKGKPEDNIDKQLISNHFLHFVALDRTDPKKFQVLQIIAALLGWSEEQREQAGLARPGASNPNLRIPVSPWHRTPSTPVLSTDLFPDSAGVGNRKESLGQLWTDFLDQEAKDEAKDPKPSTPSNSPQPRS